MKYDKEMRAMAADCFDQGFSKEHVAHALGLPIGTVKNWFYTYRAIGREALFMTKHRTYPHELKVEAAKAVVEGKMTRLEAMEAYGLKSKTQIDTWSKLYREGGPDALLPKPR